MTSIDGIARLLPTPNSSDMRGRFQGYPVVAVMPVMIVKKRNFAQPQSEEIRAVMTVAFRGGNQIHGDSCQIMVEVLGS